MEEVCFIPVSIYLEEAVDLLLLGSDDVVKPDGVNNHDVD
jgi:hypothetical protein